MLRPFRAKITTIIDIVFVVHSADNVSSNDIAQPQG